MLEKESVTQQQPETGNLLVRYFKQMPIFFPLIGLFLLTMAIYEALNCAGEDSVSHVYWLRPVILMLYFLFWAGACLTSKKSALAFLFLTILNVAFHLFGPDSLLKRAVSDLLFLPIPVNIVFSFLLLFYFRKMK